MVPRAHARVACNPNIRYWQAKLAATRSRVAAIKHHTRYGGGRAGRGRRLRVDDSPSPPRPSLREGDHGKSRVGEGGVSRRVGIADGTDAEVPTCLPPIRKPKVSCTACTRFPSHTPACHPRRLRATCVRGADMPRNLPHSLAGGVCHTKRCQSHRCHPPRCIERGGIAARSAMIHYVRTIAWPTVISIIQIYRIYSKRLKKLKA